MTLQFLHWLESIRTPFGDAFFSAVTHLGEETFFMVTAIVAFWCLNKYKGYYLLTVGFCGTILNQFLKLLCRIPRPWVRDPEFTIVESARAEADGYSFPSGHTQSVTGTLGCVARFSKSWFLRILCIVLIALTALSRMYLGVHTPADVGVSLLLSIAMVFAFYPLFEKSREQPKYLYGILTAMVICAALFVAYIELYPWPADIDAHNLASGTKNAYLLFGCSLAVLLGFHIERKHIHFEEKAPFKAQVLKTVLGLLLVVGIKAGLKPVLNPLFGGHHAATAVRYFLMVIFAICIWPLTFPWFAKGCPMKKGVRRFLSVLLIIVLVLVLLTGVLFWVVTRDTKAAPIATDDAANPLITPLGTTMLSAHRAGAGVAPENTLMALKECVESTEYQIDTFEFDVHLTADDVLVLLHDHTMDRTSDSESYFGEENVEAGTKTLAELKKLNMGEEFVDQDGQMPYAGLRGDAVPEELRIISLEEALNYVEAHGDYSYIIEIKDSGEAGFKSVDLLYDALKRYDALERTIVGTFHNEITAYMQEKYPDLLRSAGFDECLDFYVRSLIGAKAPQGGFGFAALQIPTTEYVVNLGTSRVINYAHENNIAVQYWTINDPEEIARLQAIGADTIMTDVPDVASDILVQP